jgi:hypothetical protein
MRNLNNPNDLRMISLPGNPFKRISKGHFMNTFRQSAGSLFKSKVQQPSAGVNLPF